MSKPDATTYPAADVGDYYDAATWWQELKDGEGISLYTTDVYSGDEIGPEERPEGYIIEVPDCELLEDTPAELSEKIERLQKSSGMQVKYVLTGDCIWHVPSADGVEQLSTVVNRGTLLVMEDGVEKVGKGDMAVDLFSSIEGVFPSGGAVKIKKLSLNPLGQGAVHYDLTVGPPEDGGDEDIVSVEVRRVTQRADFVADIDGDGNNDIILEPTAEREAEGQQLVVKFNVKTGLIVDAGYFTTEGHFVERIDPSSLTVSTSHGSAAPKDEASADSSRHSASMGCSMAPIDIPGHPFAGLDLTLVLALCVVASRTSGVKNQVASILRLAHPLRK